MVCASSSEGKSSWRTWVRRLVSRVDDARGRRRSLAVIERVMLAPRVGVWALQFENEVLLVGVSEGRLELLRCQPREAELGPPVTAEVSA